MDVKVFKTFLEVANTRHFGKAADNLYITQAAVSARIKQLEEFVEAPLFERVRNNIALTRAGERLLPYATTMVRAIQHIKTDIALIENQMLQFSFAATPNVWDAYFQNYLSVVTGHFQSLAFKTEMLGIRQIHTSILDNTLDLALTFDPFLAKEVNSYCVGQVDLILVSTHQDISADEAIHGDYVYVDWGAQFASEHEAKYGRHIIPKLVTSTGRIALDYILAHGGSAYLPNALICPLIEAGEIYKVKGKHAMNRVIYAVYQKHNPLVETIESVIELIEQSSPERPVMMEMIANS